MLFTQKGAMFGLDARIALAIFGALSVITGASLYSAIKEAKVVAMITELDNIDKAVTSYYLDTGVLPELNSFNIFSNTFFLITSQSVAGWNGPYLSYEVGSSLGYLGHPIYTDIALAGLEDGANAPLVSSEVGKCVNASTSCSIYSCIRGVEDDFKAAIDMKVDGVDDSENGRVKYTIGITEFICLKGLSMDPSSALE